MKIPWLIQVQLQLNLGNKEHSKKMLLLTLQTQLFYSNIDVDMPESAYLETDLPATLGELV